MTHADGGKRYYPFAVAEGIIKWLPIDADDETEFICLPTADYALLEQQVEAFKAQCECKYCKGHHFNVTVCSKCAFNWKSDPFQVPHLQQQLAAVQQERDEWKRTAGLAWQANGQTELVAQVEQLQQELGYRLPKDAWQIRAEQAEAPLSTAQESINWWMKAKDEFEAKWVAAEARVKELEQAEAERDELSGKYADLMTRYKVLVKFYDDQAGTPCEQIRHQQEVDELKAHLSTATARVKELQQDGFKHTQVWQAELDTLRKRVKWLEAGVAMGIDDYWPTTMAGKAWLAAEPKEQG